MARYESRTVRHTFSLFLREDDDDIEFGVLFLLQLEDLVLVVVVEEEEEVSSAAVNDADER